MVNNTDLDEAVELLKNLPPLLVQLTAVQAWAILSHIQLACRHPGNVGEARRIAEQIAHLFQQTIAPPGTALARLAETGWHDAFDIPRSRN